MNNGRFLIVVIVLFTLSACQAQSTTIPSAMPIQKTVESQKPPEAFSPSPTIQSTPTRLPSPTLLPPTPTYTPTPAPFLPELAAIEPANAGLIEQLAMIGKGKIYNLRFTDESRYLAADSGSGPLVYDVASQHLADPVIFEKAFTKGSERLEDRQGTRLFSRAGENILTVWNVNGENLQGVSADGSLLATISHDPNQLELWDLENYTQQEAWNPQSPGRIFTLSDFEGLPCGLNVGDGPGASDLVITSLAVHSQQPSPLLAGVCNQQSLMFFTMTGDLLGLYPLAENSFVLQLAFSPDGSRVAAFLNHTHVLVLQVSDGAVLAELPVPVDMHRIIFGSTSGLALSPDNRWVSLALPDGSLLLWDLQTPGEAFRLQDAPPIPSMFSFAPDSAVLAYSTTRHLVLFDLRSGAPIQKLDPNPQSDISGCVHDILFSPDGRYVVCQGVKKLAWDITNPASAGVLLDAAGPFAFINNPPRLVDYQENRIGLYLLSDWKLSETIPMNKKFTGVYAFAPDGELLALSYTDDIQILQRKEEKWKPLTSFEKQTAYRLIFSPQGNLLAAGTGAIENESMEALSVYSLETDKLLYRLRMEYPGEDGDSAGVKYAAAFSPDGQLLATGAGQLLKLYSASSGGLLDSLSGHTGNIQVVQFSPDGRLIATLSNDGTLRLWGVKQ